MNLARIAGGVLSRTGTKWQDLELEVCDYPAAHTLLSLSVRTLYQAFAVNSIVVSYSNYKGEIMVRDTDLRQWSYVASQRVQGPRSWRVHP